MAQMLISETFLNDASIDSSGNTIDAFSTKNDASGNKTDASGNLVISDSSTFINNGKPLLISFSKVTSKVGIQVFVAALVIFVLLGMIFRTSDTNSRFMNTVFDSVFFGGILLYAVSKYLQENTPSVPKYFINEVEEFYHDKYALLTLFLYIAAFYILVFFIKLSNAQFNPLSLLFVELFALPLIATVIIHYCLVFFVDLDIFKEFRILLGKNKNTATSDTAANVPTVIAPLKNEVFHISGNKYTYDDAQAVCKAHNSRLADYDELESAYSSGGEWCSYGWSANQMAFFPTQKNSWEELQKTEKSKNKCGRPGVNGGFFANPNIRFGVNCFGQKPAATANDLETLEKNKIRPIPQTEEEKKLDQKVEFWKNKHVNLNSFNKNKWSRY